MNTPKDLKSVDATAVRSTKELLALFSDDERDEILAKATAVISGALTREQ